MKTTSFPTLAALISSVFLFLPGNSLAAVAPLGLAALSAKATHVVTGEVTKVTSKVQKPLVENAMGYHRDRVFTITLKVEAIDKGVGIKVGQEIEIVAWKPHTRIPPIPGPQGHSSIPKQRDKATFYLTKAGKAFAPLLPNGIQLWPGRAEVLCQHLRGLVPAVRNGGGGASRPG